MSVLNRIKSNLVASTTTVFFSFAFFFTGMVLTMFFKLLLNLQGLEFPGKQCAVHEKVCAMDIAIVSE